LPLIEKNIASQSIPPLHTKQLEDFIEVQQSARISA